ncbi:MAG: ATP-binding cassette domain-containing protein [Candidatus Glassbacteria bacterium]
MIEVKDLTKFYGKTKAIENVTFDVKKGEILGFLGPNAAGKTTTMRIITCYMPASSGTVKVNGYDVFEDSIEVRKRIGYLPEHPPLYLDMPVTGYLDFVATIKGIQKKDRSRKIDISIGKCGLGEVRNTLIANLSKGFRQRVGLAQALIHEPEIMILDEPTIGLDPKQIIEVRELIKGLAGDHTVILSTHILPEVSMTCDRVVIIDRGMKIAEGSPEDLTAQLKGSEKLKLIVDGQWNSVRERLLNVTDVVNVTLEKSGPDGIIEMSVESKPGVDVRKEVAKIIIENGWGLLELAPVSMSLEDIFLQLTTKEEEVS